MAAPSAHRPSTGPSMNWREHGIRLFRFAAVSGAGLALDLILFMSLIAIGVAPFAGNMLSSAAAVTFVYAASVRRVFRHNGGFIATMFAAYAVYQLCGILIGSWAVSALIQAGAPAAFAKIAILPVTFGANYLFMCWLTSSPERWVRGQ